MWERIEDEESYSSSSRLRVPNGWIVRTIIQHHNGCAVHQTFIDDPAYAWELDKKEK